MKKRLFAIITAIAMVFAMLPNMPAKVHAADVVIIPLANKTISYGGNWQGTTLFDMNAATKNGNLLSDTEKNSLSMVNQDNSFAAKVTGTSLTGETINKSVRTVNEEGFGATLPAGTYELTATSFDEYSFPSAMITVNPKTLTANNFTIKANDKAFDKNETNPEAVLTAEFTSGSIINGDTVSAKITGHFTDASPGENIPITYTLSLEGEDAANYTLAADVQKKEVTGKIVCNHDWEDKWTTDDDNHWHVCKNECNTKGDNVAHSYSEVADDKFLKSAATCTTVATYYKSCTCGRVNKNETFTSGDTTSHTPGDAATCTTPQICINCTYEFAPATGHKYDTAWKSNSNKHWHECTNNCSTKSGEANHAFTLETVSNDTLKSAATCTTAAVYKKSCKCGAISETETFTSGEPLGHTGGKASCTEKARCTVCKAYYGNALGHDWNAWEKLDGTKHIRSCKREDCGHAEMGAHSPDLKCGTNAQSCTVCEATAASEHKFDTKTWKTDSHKHWHECTACGERKDESAHDYNKKVGADIPQTCPTCKYGGHITRVTPGGFDDGDIPESLSVVYDSVAKIQTAMGDKISELKLKSEGSQLYDAILEYSVDGGVTWYKASEHYFPDDGRLSVKMEIPEGTNLKTHNYTVLHMFSSNAFGKTAGQIEAPKVMEEKGADGKQYISFYVTGLSPIMVAWEEAPDLNSSGDETTDEGKDETKDEATGETKDEKKYPIDEDGDGKIDFYFSEDEFNADDYVAVDKDGDGITDYYVPKDVWVEDDSADSGDDSNMLPWILVMMTALTAAAITIVGRRYRKN